jgi:hypothetical protein
MRARLVAVFTVSIVAAATLIPSGSAMAAVKLDNGVGTPAALNNPQCDKALERVKFVYQAWLPCVKPWKDGADNGGATTPGVTASTIKVVIRKAPDETTNTSRSPIKDRATGEFATVEDAAADTLPVYEKVYEQWGRKFEVEVVEMSGSDEAAQRADAVSIIAMKPFAVIDLGGGDVFQSAVAARKILSISPTTGTNEQSIQQSPYRWTAGTDLAASAVLGAEFVGKVLNGKPAEFAGDPALQSKKRVFGVVRSSASGAPELSYAFAELKKRGVKVAQDLTYTLPTDTTQIAASAQEQAPTMIAKFKDAGVTSVLVLSDYQVTSALTVAATKNEYRPEWVSMGYGYVDIAALSRTFDKSQWKQAFGVLGLYPPVQGVTSGPSDLAFQWYWGPNQGAYSQAVFTAFEILYAGIHMAGPNLTPETFKAGMFARPPTGGAPEGKVTTTARVYGKHAKLPYDEYQTGGDVTLAWWDPDTVGPSVSVSGADAAGVWQFLDGAKRYMRGQLPSEMPPFFDKSKSLHVFPSVPKSDVPPTYECTGCPSATSTS